MRNCPHAAIDGFVVSGAGFRHWPSIVYPPLPTPHGTNTDAAFTQGTAAASFRTDSQQPHVSLPTGSPAGYKPPAGTIGRSRPRNWRKRRSHRLPATTFPVDHRAAGSSPLHFHGAAQRISIQEGVSPLRAVSSTHLTGTAFQGRCCLALRAMMPRHLKRAEQHAIRGVAQTR